MSRRFIAICDTCFGGEDFDMPPMENATAMDREARDQTWSVRRTSDGVFDTCPGCLDALAVREDNPRA